MNFRGLKSFEFAKKWDEALPIGNGTLGGLVFGNPINEVIVTNHEELYVPMPENSESRPYNGFKNLQKTRDLIHEGKFREATLHYLKGISEDSAPYNTIVWTNPYETAPEIHFDLVDLKETEVRNYVQKLDFYKAEANISFLYKGELFTRKSFSSRSREVLATEIRKEGNPFELDISLCLNEGVHHLESVNIYTENEYIVCEATHSEDESGFVSAIRVLTDGVMEEKEGKIRVTKANYVLTLYSLTPWKKRLEASKVKLIRALEDMPFDYDSLLKEHEAIHKELFERVMVTFSKCADELTNEELIDRCTKDTLCPELLERMTDFGKYLCIASFGKLPPNLQGIWNGNVTPPWSSDYTLDENIQMMMWQVLPSGFNGFARCYFDWLESFSEDFRKNAESYYGCKGLFAASRVSSDGFHRHFNETWPMVFWTAGAGWLSQVYEDYYEYTGDENVLLRGVKYWKEVVLFYEGFMTLDKNGRYEFAPSYSPENTPLGNDSPTAVNATMDVAIAKEVYKNLINACKILDIENENISKWEKELSLLPDYTVNEDGAVKEWIPMELKDDYHHRHSSHLYMVFPGHEAKEDGMERLFEACHTAAKYRLLDGVDAISGWGLAHLANISARLNDSELWYLAMNRLIQVFTLKNLFTGHNEHSLFQMDANLGITAAVYEMFAYSKDGRIDLLPVINGKIPYMKIENLSTRGQGIIKSMEVFKDSFEVAIENFGKKDLFIKCPKGYSFESADTEYVLHPKASVKLKGLKR